MSIFISSMLSFTLALVAVLVRRVSVLAKTSQAQSTSINSVIKKESELSTYINGFF